MSDPRHGVLPVLSDPMQIGTTPSCLAQQFIDIMSTTGSPHVLELGTMRADPGLVTHHRHWLPGTATHIKSDIQDGPDVDVVADAHYLSDKWDAVFDGVIAVAVFEHLKRPWIAARSVSRVLRPGGLVYVGTHHTFPEHGYPSDYWRFSREALALVFEDVDIEVLGTEYQYPCQIIPGPEVVRWNPGAPAWLVTELLGRKR